MKSPSDRAVERLRLLQEEAGFTDGSLPDPPAGHRWRPAEIVPNRAHKHRRPEDWGTAKVVLAMLERSETDVITSGKYKHETEGTLHLRAHRLNVSPSPLEPEEAFDRLRDDVTDLLIGWHRASGSEAAIPEPPENLPAYGVLPAGNRANAVAMLLTDGGFTLGVDLGLVSQLRAWVDDLVRLSGYPETRESSLPPSVVLDTARDVVARARKGTSGGGFAIGRDTELLRACRIFVLAHEFAHLSYRHFSSAAFSEVEEIEADEMGLRLAMEAMKRADIAVSAGNVYAGGVVLLLFLWARSTVFCATDLDASAGATHVVRYQRFISLRNTVVIPHIRRMGLSQPEANAAHEELGRIAHLIHVGEAVIAAIARVDADCLDTADHSSHPKESHPDEEVAGCSALNWASNESGDEMLARGDLDGALRVYRRELDAAQLLVEMEYENSQRGLLICLSKVGNVLRDQGDIKGALVAYRNAMEIAASLALSAPGNSEAERDLWVLHVKIGSASWHAGDKTHALQQYQEALAIAETLVKRQPNDLRWQHDLASTLEKIGVLIVRRNVSRGLASLRAAVRVREQLVQSEPENGEWQRKLSTCREGLRATYAAFGGVENRVLNFCHCFFRCCAKVFCWCRSRLLRT